MRRYQDDLQLSRAAPYLESKLSEDYLMGFILHQPYLQGREMKKNGIFPDTETKGLCYGLAVQWIKLVCTKVIPEMTDLNIFRATSCQRAYALKCLSSLESLDNDPFNIFRVNNLEKQVAKERFRLWSHIVTKNTIRHLFDEKYYSKKILAFAENQSGMFTKILADNASKYDAILILASASTGLDKMSAHALALSCSTGTPIIFNPNKGQYIYRNYSGNKQDLYFALLSYSDKFYKRLFVDCGYYILRRYAAVGISAN